MKTNYLITGLIAVLASISTVLITNRLETTKHTIQVEHVNNTPSAQTLYTKNEEGKIIPLDFKDIADDVKSGVVHIKSTYLNGSSRELNTPEVPDIFRDFFW